jgi:hypothetical protein
MFKKAADPALLVVLLAGLLVAVQSYSAASLARRRREKSRTAASLTYESTRTRLRGCPRWHVVDSRPGALYFWVTQQRRQASELSSIMLSVDRPDWAWADRRGVVRIESLRRPITTVSVDEQDTCYWRVLGEVYVAGDPDLVGEVAAYLLDDSSP